MKKQHFAVAVIVSSLLIPVFASATTPDEIRAQIQSLLSQITVLQQQLNDLVSNTATTVPVNDLVSNTTTVVPTTTDSCPKLYRTLSRGDRGEDVVSLQQFLIVQGGLLSSDSATGFFGPMTEGAVQRWQSQNSIVSSGVAASTGYGVVGARTRTAIAARCATATPVVQECPVYNACQYGYTGRTTVNAQGCTVLLECVPNTTSVTQAPVTTSLSPSSGNIGTRVTITGLNFTSTNNSVKFGGGYLNNLNSPNGTSLSFTVPEGLTPCPPGGTICPQSFMMVTPGEYSVSVINANGTSNSVTFTVTTDVIQAPVL